MVVSSTVISLYRRKKTVDPEGWRVGPRDRKKEMPQSVMAWQWSVLQDTRYTKKGKAVAFCTLAKCAML